MKFLSGSIGLFIGILLTGTLLSRCHQEELTELHGQHTERVDSLTSNYQRQINNLADVDEECAELYNRNLELEVAVIDCSTQLIMAELNCVRRINEMRKELQ